MNVPVAILVLKILVPGGCIGKDGGFLNGGWRVQFWLAGSGGVDGMGIRKFDEAPPPKGEGEGSNTRFHLPECCAIILKFPGIK